MKNSVSEDTASGDEHWYSDKDFWLTFAPVLFGNERWCIAPKEAKDVIRLMSLRPGNHLLDACCGVGRHSVEFALQGLKVTGVDQMDEYLEAARETAEAESAAIEFLCSDLRDFRREDYFDAAVSMFISIGYFENPDDEVRVFENICQSLKPDGVFLIDTIGKEILIRQFKRKEMYREDGIFVISEYRTEEEYSRLWNRWILYSGEERHEYTFSHRVYSAGELTDMLLAAGFSGVDVFGDLSGSPYNPEADRLVTLARK